MREPWEDMPEPMELEVPDYVADRIGELYEDLRNEMMEDFYNRAFEYFDEVRDDFTDEAIKGAISEIIEYL